MAISDFKITDKQIENNGVVAAPDVLIGNAKQNKMVFDRLIRETVKGLFNGLIDAIADVSGASEVGATVEGVTGETVQAILNSIKSLLDTKAPSADVTAALEQKEDKRVTNTHVKDVTFDAETGKFRFVKQDGSFTEIDTALEKIATNWTYDPETQSLVLTLLDGTTQRVSLSDFITLTEFVSSDSIEFSVSGQTVTASIKPGSVTDEMLDSVLLAMLQDYVSRAAASAAAAMAAESNANIAANNANMFSSEATKSASDARTSAEAAMQSVQQAAQFAQQAGQEASRATASAVSAAESAGKAEEAVGKTSYIGENGNWFEWDAETGNFVDSGVAAQGPQGEQGPQGPEGPQGPAGEGSGDMEAEVYDPRGMAQDVFKYVDDAIAAIPVPDVSGAIAEHNTYSAAHRDIRVAVSNAATAASDAQSAAEAAANAAAAAQNAAAGKLSFEANASAEVVTAAMPVASAWSAAAYGNGKFVSIAANTNIAAYSDDGVTWEQTTLPSSANWWGVAYGNGKFVAVAAMSSVIAYSTDGVTWHSASLPETAFAAGITYGNGKFVMPIMASSKVFYSDDGVIWNAGTLPEIANWKCAAFGNGAFVIIANTSDAIVYSEDGVSWEKYAMPVSGSWMAITFANNLFVAVSANDKMAAISHDGKNWNSVEMPISSNWYSVAYGCGKFVAISVNSNVAAYSEDGVTWEQSVLPSSVQWNGFTYGSGKFVVIANGGSTTVAISEDGVNWSTTYAQPNALFQNGADVTEQVKGVLGGGGIQTVKLKEVTTTAAAAQVEFDLSDIDLDRYQELKFCMELLPESKISYAEPVWGYFNVVAASGPNNTMQSVKAIGSSTTMAYLHGQFSNTSTTLFPSFWTIRTSVSELQNSLSVNMGRYSLVGESYCVMRDAVGRVSTVADNSCQFHALISELSKLILVVQNEGGTQQKIAAGSKLKVYGVLR